MEAILEAKMEVDYGMIVLYVQKFHNFFQD